MSGTLLGIACLVGFAVLKYGGNMAAGLSWLWGKVPALPKLPSLTKTTTAPTAAEAFAALTLIESFKANAKDDPGYELILAAFGKMHEAKA